VTARRRAGPGGILGREENTGVQAKQVGPSEEMGGSTMGGVLAEIRAIGEKRDD